MWDADADGTADHSVLDLDDDGRGERAWSDPSGRGVWDRPAEAPAAAASTAATDPPTGAPPAPGVELAWTDVRGRAGSAPPELDTDRDGVADAAEVEADHDPTSRELVCDPDADGRAEQLLVDHEADGRYESVYTSSTTVWDVLLADTDADGAVDLVVDEGAPDWVPP